MATYKFIILNHLEELRRADPGGGWIKEGLLRGIDTKWGFLGFRGDRDTRDLIKKGMVESKMDGKFRVVRAKMAEVLIAGVVADEGVIYNKDFLKNRKIETTRIL